MKIRKTLVQIFALGIFGCSFKSVEPEIHLIPSEFRGHVIIDFEITDGTPSVYENNFRIYKIPENGHLKTAFHINPGIRPVDKNLFFQISDDGVRQKLPHLSDSNLLPVTVVVSNLYVIGNSLHYFVDALQKINQYPNPAIEESSRQ